MKLFGTLFVGAVLATCLAIQPVNLEEPPSASKTSAVAKTVFSSKLRLVMTLGVEGTGHAFVVSVISNMFRSSPELLPIPRKYIVSSRPYHILTSMNSTALEYSAVLDAARNQMRNLAKRGAKLKYPGTLTIFRKKNSYPDGKAPNKVMKYLDLRLLAEVAEEEGVDFRVLYLKRSAKDLIIADTVHRKFQGAPGTESKATSEQLFLEYMQILLTDTAVVHSFLEELDPAFVMCHDFDHIDDVKQASAVANFLAPNAAVAEPLQASYIAMAYAHDGTTEILPYEGANVIASRLQRKLDALESFCCAGG